MLYTREGFWLQDQENLCLNKKNKKIIGSYNYKSRSAGVEVALEMGRIRDSCCQQLHLPCLLFSQNVGGICLDQLSS